MASKLEIILTAKNETSGAINQVKSALGGLGSAATAAVTAAGLATAAAVAGVTAAVGVGVGKAADLEQGLADIASVMGVTFDEAKPLGDLIQSLGIDPKLKVDAVGASDAIMQLAQSGISMADILDGAARSTVLLSNATGGDMATSAAVASDAMALFGINAKDMKTAVDGITGVTIASKFGIQDYALALSQGGGVAAVAGVSFADFNTTIAAISPYFASGSDAGTSFKTFLQRLVPQSNEATGAMRDLGLITADGRNQFFDATGQMRSMSEIAGILATATAGLSEEQKTATLSTIFGADAIRAAAAIAETGSANFDQLAGSLAKVDADKSASTRMNTFASQLEILQGVVDGLLTEIGQAFLPILRDLANWATDYVSKNGAQLVAWFRSLADWIQQVMPLIVSWGGVMIGALGELTAWVQGQHTTFGNLTQLWTLLQGAIGTAVAAIVAYMQNNWPTWVAELAKWGRTAWQWIVDSMPTVLAKLGELWVSIKKWLDDNAMGLGTKLLEWGGKFTAFVTGVQSTWAKIWPDIQGIIGRAATSISDDIGRIISSLTRIDTLLKENAPQQKQSALDWGKFWVEVVDIIAAAVSSGTDMIANLIESIALLGESFRALGAGDWGRLQELNQRALELARMVNMFTSPMQYAFQALEQRAVGGPVWAGQGYVVGERGPEFFVPEQNGTIAPNGSRVTSNTYNVYLSGSGNAGSDVMSTVQTLQALYG